MAPAPKHSYDQERKIILDAAISCIEQTSIMDFTMSALSKEAGISMGSIYKHIRSKEDVIVALATDMQLKLFEHFSTVFALPLSFPVRMIALQMTADEAMCSHQFGGQLDMMVANEAILQRASDQWVEQYMAADIALEELVNGALLDAVQQGELAAKKENREAVAEEIMVGCWSMCVGFTQVARQRHTRHLVGKGVDIPSPLNVNDTIIQAVKRLLNTYPWAEPVTDQAIVEACELLTEKNLR